MTMMTEVFVGRRSWSCSHALPWRAQFRQLVSSWENLSVRYQTSLSWCFSLWSIQDFTDDFDIIHCLEMTFLFFRLFLWVISKHRQKCAFAWIVITFWFMGWNSVIICIRINGWDHPPLLSLDLKMTYQSSRRRGLLSAWPVALEIRKKNLRSS